MLGASLKNPIVLLNYMGGLQSHLWKQVMLFKTRKVDETFVQAKYLENIGYKKRQQSGHKKLYHKYASK
jgi:hypothetical protein